MAFPPPPSLRLLACLLLGHALLSTDLAPQRWLSETGLSLTGLSEWGMPLEVARSAAGAEPIPRVLPPEGVPLTPEVREELQRNLDELRGALQPVADHPSAADVEVYVKALELALHFGEFYGPKDAEKARFAVQEARQRLDRIARNEPPAVAPKGLTVRGYRSRLDGSAQPYGVVLPKGLDSTKSVPLYVWLHGRGDKQTDLHFIHERHHSVGQIAPPDAIVVHPFGRHCLGFKSAGEVDVLEVVEHAQTQYKIDPRRIVLIGFSMGGAGAWHLGAHYTDRWCAVSPGAGFAETARYVRLTPDKYPPPFVQTLWGCYDVPAYVRNLFNVPVIAYSGENDKQIQAARVMEEAFQLEGRELRHLIGPGVEHKYEPGTLQQLLGELHTIVQQGGNPRPKAVSLQTRTLRYARQFWVEAQGLGEHWRDSRIDARRDDDGTLRVDTRNVTRMRLTPPGPVNRLLIDEQEVKLEQGTARSDATDGQSSLPLQRGADDRWSIVKPATAAREPIVKRPGLQGPIDDAFLEPFLIVTPSGPGWNPAVDKWVAAELEHAIERWQAVCRGRPRVKRDVDVTDEDVASKNLILWGDPKSNQRIGRIHKQLPLRWTPTTLEFAGDAVSASHHVPVLIYPNPDNARRYVVLNSGLTFRESHDRTNSQQNPKLPDWALVDVSQPADGEWPGRIVRASFFDESWLPRK